MSVAPLKVTGLTVKNTLNANEAWVDKLHVKNTKTKKSIDILEYINSKLESVNQMEAKLKETISEINKVVQEIHTLKDNITVPSVNSVPEKGEKGDKGDKGDPGISGVGKVGPRGLRGLRGEPGANKFADMKDVDLSDLKDGSVLVWVSNEKKWAAQSIFDD